MTSQNAKAAAATLEQLFQPPSEQPKPAMAGWGSLQIEDNLFTADDVEIIGQLGVMTWAMRKQPAQTESQPLQWQTLPALLRNNIMTDVIEAVGSDMQYVVPIRHIGRVLTFALLPADRQPIRVNRRDSTPSTPTPPRRTPIVYRDPPVPFLTMGLATPAVLQQHGQIVRQILHEDAGRQLAPATMMAILEAIARTGEATASEVLCYLTELRALVSGAWRYMPENYPLQAVEYLIRQSESDNPLQPQLLAQAHLVERRPIDWGEEADPLRVTLKPG